MTWLIAAAAYITGALLTARWFYRINAEDGNIDTSSINDIMISAAVTLLIGAFWPLVWAWLGAMRFVVKPKGDTQ
jgi:hypothetical protein